MTGDTVYVLTQLYSDSPSLTLHEYHGLAPTTASGQTTNLLIDSGGTLEVTSGVWEGTASDATVTFSNSSNNYGTVGSTVVFGDSSVNFGTANGDVTFNDSAYNQGSVNGIATFNLNSHNDYYVYGDATFNGSSTNTATGVVTGNGTFNDQSNDHGTVSGTLSWGAGNTNVLAAGGPIYVCSTGALDWTSTYTWFQDSGCTTRAGRIPANGDAVVVGSSVQVLLNIPTTLSLSAYTGGYDLGTVGVTIASGGSLNVIAGIWTGTVDASVTVVFDNGGSNRGTINGSATFKNGSYNFGTVKGTAYFVDSTNSIAYGYGTLMGDAEFSGASTAYGAISGNATFSDTTVSYATVSGTATFNDSASNMGTVASAEFNDSSGNSGTVSGDATFNQSSTNYTGSTGGHVSGNATFNGSSTNAGGTVGQNATFNGSSQNSGTVNGSISWDASNPYKPLDPGSTFYYCGNGYWTDTANWHADGGCSAAANRVPADGDSVELVSGGSITYNIPTISLVNYTGAGPGYDMGSYGIASGITVTGTLHVTDGVWWGATSSSATAQFSGSSINKGSIAGAALFEGTSQNYIYTTVGGVATFKDSANNIGTVASAIFNGSSANCGPYTGATVGGTVTGDATFNDSGNPCDGTNASVGTAHWGAGNPYAPAAAGSQMYLCGMSVAWNTKDNWKTDSGCTTAANRLPATGDYVTVYYAFWDNAPATDLASYSGPAGLSGGYQTTNLNITSGGTLSISQGDWGGSTAAGTTVTFTSTSNNSGHLGGDATFQGTSTNTGRVDGTANFGDGSYNNGGSYGNCNGASSAANGGC